MDNKNLDVIINMTLYSTCQYLELYKDLWFINPEWIDCNIIKKNNLNCLKNINGNGFFNNKQTILNKNINYEIICFILTHKIDDKYNIQYWNLNNIFQRTIWGVITNITKDINNKKYYDKNEYYKFRHLMDSFILLSIPKTKIQFYNDYCKIINKDDLTNQIDEDDYENENFFVPYNIWNKWKYISSFTLNFSSITKFIDKDYFFLKFHSFLKPEITTINNIKEKYNYKKKIVLKNNIDLDWR